MLSRRENQILSLTAVGMTPNEIGDVLFISHTTVQTTQRNIKRKLNLQKAAELTAYYWCNVLGSTLEEQKKRILSTTLAIGIFLTSINLSSLDMRRSRRLISLRRVRIEHVIQTEA